MDKRILITGTFAAVLALAACGDTTERRAATGGLGGAAAGGLVGGPVGAVIGGAAGAGTGAIMEEGAEEHVGDAIDEATD